MSVYIKKFQALGYTAMGTDKSEIWQTQVARISWTEADVAVLKQNFVFLENLNLCFLRPFNWLDGGPPALMRIIFTQLWMLNIYKPSQQHLDYCLIK